jgi:alkaline phosphatase
VFTRLSLTIAATVISLPILAQETPEKWFSEGHEAVQSRLSNLRTAPARAKNVILFIGDGMGVSTVTAARILAGQLAGNTGEENELFFENFSNVAFSKTYNVNQQTPDSAGTMTAMATGVKTNAGLISVNQYVSLGDCASMQGNSLPTLLEMAENKGMSTGIVTTARLTHATPAANYAHSMHRNFEDDGDTAAMSNPGNCIDIARQLVEFTVHNPNSDGLEVALGGGRLNFLPKAEGADPEEGVAGARLDGRDLSDEWQKRYPNAAYVWNKAQFDAIDVGKTEHLLGLFEGSHMEYELDRAQDKGGEPSLTEMTESAIRLLEKNPKGYYLNVEAGRIDNAHHATNPQRALLDTIELANAVRKAYEMTDPNETLIIVTADHSHVLTLAGYPTRGNPILGKVIGNDDHGAAKHAPELAADGLPYTTLGYLNGPGHQVLEDFESADAIFAKPINLSGRADLSAVDTTAPGFHPETLVPIGNETHGGEDVAVYATGPGAELVSGLMEQNVLFHIMSTALQLEQR